MTPPNKSTDGIDHSPVEDKAGLGFDWIETQGTPAGGYWKPRPGTCPYPIGDDFSVAACQARGDCGCVEAIK